MKSIIKTTILFMSIFMCLHTIGQNNKVSKDGNIYIAPPTMSNIEQNLSEVKKIFYSIDRLSFPSLSKRNEHENKLQNSLKERLNRIISNENVTIDYEVIDNVETIIDMAFEMIQRSREQNSLFDFLEDKEILTFYQKEVPQINLQSAKANNNELCHLAEYALLFNACISIYEIIDTHISDMENDLHRELAAAKDYNNISTQPINIKITYDFITKTDLDGRTISDQVAEVERISPSLIAKIDILKSIASIYFK